MLEAWGNATTTQNRNSSRFGKWLAVHFDPERCSIASCSLTPYLLEKSRVVVHGVGERSYHVFYQLLVRLLVLRDTRSHPHVRCTLHPHQASAPPLVERSYHVLYQLLVRRSSQRDTPKRSFSVEHNRPHARSTAAFAPHAHSMAPFPLRLLSDARIGLSRATTPTRSFHRVICTASSFRRALSHHVRSTLSTPRIHTRSPHPASAPRRRACAALRSVRGWASSAPIHVRTPTSPHARRAELPSRWAAAARRARRAGQLVESGARLV